MPSQTCVEQYLLHNPLCLLSVGGLLQTRFLSQLPDSPRSSPAAVRPPGGSSLWTIPQTLPMAPRASEPLSIRTVGARRLGGPVILKESVTHNKVQD